jgi:hypothetical protein
VRQHLEPGRVHANDARLPERAIVPVVCDPDRDDPLTDPLMVALIPVPVRLDQFARPPCPIVGLQTGACRRDPHRSASIGTAVPPGGSLHTGTSYPVLMSRYTRTRPFWAVLDAVRRIRPEPSLDVTHE